MRNDEGLTALGLRIREERDAQNLTQDQLAKKANCTKGAVSQWERGNVNNLRIGRLFLVADALGVTARWLATGSGAKKPFSAALAGEDRLLMQLINIYGQVDDDKKHELVTYANFLLTQGNSIPSASNPFPGAPHTAPAKTHKKATHK